MKTFSIYEPMSKEYFDIWTKNFKNVTLEYLEHSREDYHLQSTKYPIFVIADGVTLKRDSEGNYPNPSGAGELAKEFCKLVIDEAERLYDAFSEPDLNKIFEVGNEFARMFNAKKGITKEVINYREKDFFAVVSSFVLIKDNKMYWWSICDAGIAVFDRDNNQIFNSPPREIEAQEYLPQNWSELTTSEQNIFLKKTFRNAIDSRGNKIGYGVINGEVSAQYYLNTGILNLSKNELVCLFSDGFEPYLKLPELNNLLRNSSGNIENDIKSFSDLKTKDNIKFYGQERSLISVEI